jgi:hypothetical protein
MRFAFLIISLKKSPLSGEAGRKIILLFSNRNGLFSVNKSYNDHLNYFPQLCLLQQKDQLLK